ncbi:Smr/MutS family protein [Ferruginibacter albus]|uniref:Smr/MutS family protein n=1 Tax=Ferruginibacter albus TaxID=2875540 RepID=UPI001CC48DF8|nr:Smr/MutS family protein [Ferruginibacter albus]UAY53630.1 hypothetical protein K9M53_08165 [Ferruginibacter albus]
MKYQPGDTILILATNEEGKVIEELDNNMVLVEVKGIRFPVYKDQVDFPYFKMFSEKKLMNDAPVKKYIDNIKKEKSNVKQKVSDGVFLSFLPVYDKDVFDDNVINKFKLYLINQTDEAYHFDYSLFYSGDNQFQLRNQIEPLAEFYLNDIQFEDLNDNPRFDFEFSLVNEDKTKAPYYEYSLKPKAKQLFKKIEEMQVKNQAAFTYEIFKEYPFKTEEIIPDMPPGKGYKLYDISRIKEHVTPARRVVDLHIEKLSDNWKHLSNFEILTIQLKEFEKYYDLAVFHYQPSLIVIHGIGIGKLKDEIHNILRNKKEVRSFINQYHPNYGYGATEIYFSY